MIRTLFVLCKKCHINKIKTYPFGWFTFVEKAVILKIKTDREDMLHGGEA